MGLSNWGIGLIHTSSIGFYHKVPAKGFRVSRVWGTLRWNPLKGFLIGFLKRIYKGPGFLEGICNVRGLGFWLYLKDHGT